MEERDNKENNVKEEKNSKLKTVFIAIILILIYFDACAVLLLFKNSRYLNYIPNNIKQENQYEKINSSEKIINSSEETKNESFIEEKNMQSKNDDTSVIEESNNQKKSSSSSEKIKQNSVSSSVASSSINIISYNVYNDGTKEIRSTRTQTEYDRSNFIATTNDLKAEAQTARNTNAGMISKAWQITNSYRKEANEKAVDNITDRKDLVLDENLCLAASVRAVEMAYTNKMTHTRPNGSVCFTVLKDLGISYYICGENIAAWQNSADAACKTWKNSPGHYSNMISPSYGKIGIGVYKAGGGYFWAQIFTN